MIAFVSTLLLLIATSGTEATDAAAHTVPWDGEQRVQWALAEANWRLRHGTPADAVEAWLRTQMPDESGAKRDRSWNAYERASRRSADPSAPTSIAAGPAPMPANHASSQDTHALPNTP